jgi:hypothetical protein
MNKRRKTTIALILTVAIASGYGAQTRAAGAASSPLAHGTTNVGCHATFVTQQCSLVVQPGTVADLETIARNYSGTMTGLIAGIAGFMCFPAGPLAFVCGLVAVWRAEVFLDAIRDAAAQHRCVHVAWDQLYGIPVPININVTAYGAPATWVWTYEPGTLDFTKVWANPTACEMGGLPAGVV